MSVVEGGGESLQENIWLISRHNVMFARPVKLCEVFIGITTTLKVSVLQEV